MREGWLQTKLGELLSFSNGRSSPDREDGLPFPVYGSNGIIGASNQKNAAAGTIVVGRVGTYCGSIYLAKTDCWVTDNAIKAVAKDENDPRYIFFLLSTLGLNNWRAGSGQPLLNQQILSSIPVIAPTPLDQRAIAATLGALDDKIELNRRMNQTLEAMARALFRDWFVDFGPTRAKMAARAPYLSPDLWSLFPDRLDDEGKPEGWEVAKLGSFTAIKNGYAFKSSDWASEGVAVVKIGSVKPGVVDLSQVSYVSKDLAISKAEYQIAPGDILVGLTGYVGETGVVPPCEVPPLLNQRVGKFEPFNGQRAIVQTAVRNPAFKEFAEKAAHGSAQANVSTRDLLNYPLLHPGDRLVREFATIVEPLQAKALANFGQNQSLAQTRDLLLPRLMSGELRMAEVENLAREVA